MYTAAKKSLAIVLSIWMLLCCTLQICAADKLPDPPASCVYDPAGVIEAETEQQINQTSNALYALAGAQIVVVAVDKTGYSDLSEYADDLFNDWKIGSKEQNNGVLFVMETSTYKYWAALGQGLEKTVTSAVLQRIFDSGMESAFDQKEYDKAAKIFCEEMTETLELIYDIDTKSWDGVTYHYGSAADAAGAAGGGSTGTAVSIVGTIFSGIIGLLITVAVIVIVIFALLRASCFPCGGPGGGYRYRYGRPFWGGYHHHHHHYGPGPGPRPGPRPGGPRPGGFGGGHTGGFGGGRGGGFGGFGGGGSRGAGGGRR